MPRFGCPCVSRRPPGLTFGLLVGPPAGSARSPPSHGWGADLRTWSRCAPPACTEHARRKTNTRPDPIKCCSEALPFPWAAASGRRRHRAPCAPIGSLAAGSRPACALGLRVGQTLTAHDASGVAPASAPVRVAAPGDHSPLPVPAAASGPWLPAPPRPPVLPRSHCHLCLVKTSVPLAGFDSKGAAPHRQDEVRTL